MHELGSGLGAPTPAPYCQLRQGSRTHVTFGSVVRKTSKTCSAELSAYLLAPLCPRLTSGITPTVWVERLSCLVSPAFALEQGLIWLGVVPIQCEIGAIFTHRWCDFWNGSRCG